MVVCASGDGSNFEALVIASRAGLLQTEVVGLICNNPQAGALKRAERLKVPVAMIERNDDEATLRHLMEWQAEWVALAGFLSKIGPKVLEKYSGKIVNSHPSLLPKYGGKGMYGSRIHQAVLQAGDTVSGVTVHLVGETYDTGRILAQKKVPIERGDTAETLEKRVKQKERAFYPAVLNDLVTGRIT
jgi:phosphoribosylglycinamide formyltransferase-1